VWDEDDRRVEDVCYLCGGAGETDPETAAVVLLQHCSEAMAHAAVAKLRDKADNDPEGGGWAFRAAENMMTERDYTRVREMELADRFMVELGKLGMEAQDALVEALLRSGFAAPDSKTAPADKATVYPVYDDIPF